jgi:hypothetical protein
MAKRNGKKVADDLRVEPGELVETAAGAAASPSDPPSVEDRLAKLESLLAESNQIILQQASAIAIGVENAERLRKSRERLMRLEHKADEAKKAATEAKKAYETAVSEHFDLERDLDSPQQRLPFSAAIDEPARPDARPEPVADESWRGVSLDTFDLSKATVAKLFQANLTTVGELSDYLRPVASGYCRKLQDIDGIGAAKAEEIENALERFWMGQAVPRTFPTADANAEILAGVAEVEVGRAEDDEDNDDDVQDDRDVPMSEEEVASWGRDAGTF